MTTADQLALIERALHRQDEGSSSSVSVTATFLAEAGLVLAGWQKTNRLLALVAPSHAPQSHALAVLVSASSPVLKQEDLSLEHLLPMDSALFRCEIDSGDAGAVFLKVSHGPKQRFMFEMLPGYHTQNIVAEIYRLKEQSETKKKDATDWSWVEEIKKVHLKDQTTDSVSSTMERLSVTGPSGEGMTSSPAATMESQASAAASLSSHDQDLSPEASLSRQDIAVGATPIAARESVVKYQMALKEDQFTELQPFVMFTGTYNVNGQAPSGMVSEWLACDEEPPDIYAIGFQELDLSKEAFVFNESPREEEWCATVAASLHPKAKYKRVKLIRLVGMMLIVFVQESHVKHVNNVAAETVGTGIMGKLGNKGGVAVRLDFHNTSICFVNAHLAAHMSEFERRNQDYQEICSRMVFGQFVPPKTIKDHDMVYWIGDLNYRIELENTIVRDLITEANIETLLECDQLKQQKHQRRIFVGYSEGDITFQPTYKYDPGTDDWDSSEKARAPAWTDRILWHGDHITQTDYRSHKEVRLSDHKPVSALFKSLIKVVDPVKYRKIYEDVMKKLDRLENEFLPQVTVETTEILYDEIKFMEPAIQLLAVANTGQVPVQYEFIKKLNDSSICKPWLSVEPSTGFIMPGDKSDICLEVLVNKKTAGPLNAGQDQMYDILVLHLVGGKDIFITVSGSYKKSAFGASINALCHMTVPISELSVKQLNDLERDDNEPEEEPYPVPKELWFLCDMITELGLNTEQLFLQPGLRSEMTVLRDWLDTGLPVTRPAVSIHSAVETLLVFLESLRHPIIPYNMYSRCIDSAPNYLQCKQIVSQLPTHHRNVFYYMTAFLREVIRHSAQNGIDPKILATLFSSIFLRDPPGTNLGSGIRARSHQQILEQKKARFIYHFLVNDAD